MSLRVVSLFSGVGGFDLGLERAGMTTVAQVEWDPKCQQVLARHWPHVPRWGDVSDVNGADLPDCDLVAFGSPCQDLSVAGKRAGMVEGETRSGLFYEAVRIIKELQEDDRGPAWVVWENVAGALSSNGGRDFGAVIDSLADIGAVDIQWRVLDAQWFGVPQRRRRVFVVARLNPSAAGGPQVLPVGASVRRDSATGSETGQDVAPRPAGCLGLGAGKTDELDGHGAHVVIGPESEQTPTPVDRVPMTETDRMASIPLNTTTTPSVATQQQLLLPEITGTVTTTWAKGPGNTQVEEGHVIPVAVAENQRGEVRTSNVVSSIGQGGGKPGQGYPAALTADLEVRRLTPTECERLMGWPDGWTAEGVDADGNPVTIAVTNRYRMCGNGVASPVAEWIGRCILDAEAEQ